ncbi:mono-functional DNA-alkylating methyl methanesulfonate N-term-domain-containing protein [Cantharellus anzutake]|uniref:mono-functional DNA-alkylating methyl methanesulfonate N-term-domain-containing protein n=1 Tax=Cantharellus anzutake TaxID=1750568 RepID=UPI001904B21F|nr:mono-functional DNA-alkylating methyl methanesulfonate N-term-domain-containing protein [Cantharellus anzutake]KAF8333519.1 mono-functional DNA-alkylating methyl methanesulfonate N-term-domain-containing protein [Cantharellus anzutake]
MHIVSTWSPSSSVYFSGKIGENALVVAKSNRIEVIELAPDGLHHRCSLEIWGTITSLNVLRQSPYILITTDHPRPTAVVINYNAKLSALTVIRTVSLLERSSRFAEYYQGAEIHEASGIAVALSYSASLKVIPVLSKELAEFDCRSSATPLPTVAMLYIDLQLRRRIVAREVDLENKEISIEPSPMLPQTQVSDGATLIVPLEGVDGHAGYVLVLGGGQGQLFEIYGTENLSPAKRIQRKDKGSETPNRRKRARDSADVRNSDIRVELPFAEVAAYAEIDSQRMLLADQYGRLAILLCLCTPDSGAINELKCRVLGEVNSPSTITYLNDGIVYVGSHFGDSQLVRILQTPVKHENGTVSRVEVLETYKNIAPIVDAVITHTDGSSQVVTCSGGYNAGSLRVVRKGADFKELVAVERMPRISAMWPLRFPSYDKIDRFLLYSTLYSTALIDISDSGHLEEMTPDRFPDLERGRPTLAAGSLDGYDGNAFVQVTNNRVIILDLSIGAKISEWPTPKNSRRSIVSITVACVNPTQIALALQGGELLYLIIDKDMKIIEQSSRIFRDGGEPREVCALSINPMWSSFPHESRVLAAAFWGSNAVNLLKLPTLQPVSAIPLSQGESHLPRSVLLHTFGDTQPYLLAGLADGSLVAYELEKRTLEPRGKRVMGLGNLPMILTPCRHGADKPVVFVSGNRPAVLFLDNGRLQHSPIVLKASRGFGFTKCAALIHSVKYPDALLLAGPDNLVIGQLRELHKLNIRTIPLGLDNPHKICYDPDNKVFGLGILRNEPSGLNELSVESTPSFRVLDELTFETFHDFNLPSSEEVTSIGSFLLSCSGTVSRYFVIGTEITAPIPNSPHRGKIRVHRMVSVHAVDDITTLPVNGGVASLDCVDNKVVACVNSAVILYELAQTESDLRPTLIKLASWDRGYHLHTVRVRGDVLVTADALRSLDVLTYSGKGFSLRARDHSALWPIAMETVDGEHIMVAEAWGHKNLFTYKAEGGLLDRIGTYHLGERITSLQKGSLVTNDNKGVLWPSLVYFTVNGQIGVISETQGDFPLLLTELQRNMGYVLEGPGKVEHAAWRSPVNINGSLEGDAIGFIDGDFIERFLLFPKDSGEVARIMQGRKSHETLKVSYEEILQALEQLQLVH